MCNRCTNSWRHGHDTSRHGRALWSWHSLEVVEEGHRHWSNCRINYSQPWPRVMRRVCRELCQGEIERSRRFVGGVEKGSEKVSVSDVCAQL